MRTGAGAEQRSRGREKGFRCVSPAPAGVRAWKRDCLAWHVGATSTAGAGAGAAAAAAAAAEAVTAAAGRVAAGTSGWKPGPTPPPTFLCEGASHLLMK